MYWLLCHTLHLRNVDVIYGSPNRFVDYVIDEASKQNCFDRQVACRINGHLRQVQYVKNMCLDYGISS